jgi:hypothetical protein
MPDKIYVRECYRDLYELAATGMLNLTSTYSVTLFTGVPGIGKSLFLVYFIYRFLSDERFPDKRFALEFDRGEYNMFEPIGSAGNTFKMTTLDAKCVHPKDFLLLCDIIEPAQPKGIAKWTLIFSSPDPQRYKEMIKTSCARKFTMPTWSELELRFLAPNNKDWFDAFCTFGGVPRHVFPGPIGGNPHHLLNNSLTAKGFDLAASYFVRGFGATDEKQNYMLFHINPPEITKGVYDYSGYPEYSFASSEIFDRLAEMNTQCLITKAINLFNDGVASETIGGVAAGKLFELVCLRLSPITGHCLKATRLYGPVKSTRSGGKSKSTDASSTFPIAADTEDFQVPATRELLSMDWKKAHQLEANKLYVPRVDNMESGDAFYLVPTDGSSASSALAAGRGREQAYMLVVLQVTVAASHPVKANGLVDIVDAFPEALQSNIKKKALLFVKDAHGTFDKEQAIVNQARKVMAPMNIPIKIRDFEQYVCSYLISASPPAPRKPVRKVVVHT